MPRVKTWTPDEITAACQYLLARLGGDGGDFLPGTLGAGDHRALLASEPDAETLVAWIDAHMTPEGRKRLYAALRKRKSRATAPAKAGQKKQPSSTPRDRVAAKLAEEARIADEAWLAGGEQYAQWVEDTIFNRVQCWALYDAETELISTEYAGRPTIRPEDAIEILETLEHLKNMVRAATINEGQVDCG